MQRALQLAGNGVGTTRPNPSVGAVIVYKDNIIGEGFTDPYGGPHAEVIAIGKVKNQEHLKEATIYVTLEPCSHYGKTPPCSDLIIEKGIPEIVIGCVDTNVLVAGKGIEKLKNANRNVVVGVLEKQCLAHHKRFFTYQNKQRPYVILKWAESKNGFIAPLQKQEKKPVWISNPYSRQLVHKLRTKEHAILVGTNTVLQDNPKLNARNWFGNNPIRVILDRKCKITSNFYVTDAGVKTIFITQNKPERVVDDFIVYEEIDFSENIARQILEVLFTHKIQSLIVEGGTKTLQTFINENLWDEASVFVGERDFDNGIPGPQLRGRPTGNISIENDLMKTFIND